MPRTKKPPGTAVDRRNGRKLDLEVVGVQHLPLPDKPEDDDWCAEARAAWEGYWADDVIAAATAADQVLQLRWIDAVDRYVKCTRAADREPVTSGSTGQDRENPLYAVAARAMATIQVCEKQLGIGPSNRAALGITVVQQKRSLADLNRQYGSLKPVLQAADEDPRLAR